LAMEPPSSLDGESVRNEKVKIFNCIRPLLESEIDANAVRGQYGPGTMGGKRVPGYRQEPDVPADSRTETYAALRLQVENWRWAGVPFYLRSGKRLARRETEIVIQYRRPPLTLFRQRAAEQVEPNRLVIRVQPDEGIALHVKAKVPGPSINLATVRMDFSYKDFGAQPETTGYEQLLYDCMAGDSSLFHREDMVETAWKIATPILDRWDADRVVDFPNYASGSWGPEAADRLIGGDGRKWSHHE
ncbi:MAG TPA: glucose-6-phosphate dehydrogenase, partial [Myxococcaceae bacterium]|nr:glucose-6-phosphate dehydrogenase [Myxococcaceae bacterium]